MLYFIEITDTFGGDANYSWVTRHCIKAKSYRGAFSRLSRLSGINWRKTGEYGDSARYDSASGATCAFIQGWEPEYHGEYRLSTNDGE